MAEERYVKKSEFTGQAVVPISRSAGDVQYVPLEDGKTLVGDSSDPEGYSQVTVGGGSDAADTTYTPDDDADWDTPPDDVGSALDELAARDTGGSAGTLLSIALTSTAGYDDVNGSFFYVPETGIFTINYTLPVTDVVGAGFLEFVINNEASAVAKLLRLSVLVTNLDGSGDFLHCRDIANGTTIPASSSLTIADFTERAVSGTSIVVDAGNSEGLNLVGAGDYVVTFHGRFDNQ